MTDEHICCICGRRPYERRQVCDPCRGRLTHTIATVAHLWAQLPQAMQPGQNDAQRVTGSREAPIPLNVDVVDLSAQARNAQATDAAKAHPEDQIGQVAVASILDQWCRDWRDEMAFRQSLPEPTVPALAKWLGDRVEWAADRHPAVDEFAAEMGRLRAVLRGVLGLAEPQAEFCDGVVCRKCDRYALYREGDYVECDHCGLLYSEKEYQDWAALVAATTRCPVCEGKVTKAVQGHAITKQSWPVTYYPCQHTAVTERMAA